VLAASEHAVHIDRYLGGANGPAVLAMPNEPPGGTVQIRAGIWADLTFTRRRDGYWSGRTDTAVAVWSWLELLSAAGPDGVRPDQSQSAGGGLTLRPAPQHQLIMVGLPSRHPPNVSHA
jgi:hypothetical protein